MAVLDLSAAQAAARMAEGQRVSAPIYSLQLSALFVSLYKRGIVILDGTKVSYELPAGP
jgi:hypothetical protein